MLATLFRPRYILFVLLIILVPMLDIATDPDNGIVNSVPFGASFIVHLVLLGRAAIAVLALHWLISYIFDALELDIVKMAKEHPEHNGLYAIAVAITSLAFAVVIQAVLSI